MIRQSKRWLATYDLFMEEKFLLRSTEQEFEAAQLMVLEFRRILGTAQRPDEESVENGFVYEIRNDRAGLVLTSHFIGKQRDCMLKVRQDTTDIILID